MRRALLRTTVAIILGIASGQWLTNNLSFRHWIAQVVRRGELMMLVNRHGIYDTDVERAWHAKLFANGGARRMSKSPRLRTRSAQCSSG